MKKLAILIIILTTLMGCKKDEFIQDENTTALQKLAVVPELWENVSTPNSSISYLQFYDDNLIPFSSIWIGDNCFVVSDFELDLWNSEITINSDTVFQIHRNRLNNQGVWSFIWTFEIIGNDMSLEIQQFKDGVLDDVVANHSYRASEIILDINKICE